MNTHKYRVMADDGADKNPEQVHFVVSDIGYKQAWSNARNVCRVGSAHYADKGAPVMNLDGEEVTFGAGKFTVRKVFAVDRQRGGGKKKAAVLSAEDLIRVATERGIKPSKALLALFEELKASGVPAATPEGDEATGTEDDEGKGAGEGEGEQVAA